MKKSILSKIKRVDKYLGVPINFLVFLFDKILIFKKKPSKKINKILIIRLGAIGDSIISIPMIRELKRNYPKSKITMLTTSKTGGIYDNIPYLNNVISFKFKEEKNIFYSGYKNMIGLIKILSKLKKENYSVVIDTEQYSRITPLISYYLSNQRIGFDSEGEGRGFLLTAKIEHDENKHEVECFLDLIKPLNIKIKNKTLEFPIKRDKFVDDFFKENKISKRDLVIAIHPGNSIEFAVKRWPKERFAEITRYLTDKYKAKIILVGAPHETELTNEIKRLSKRDLIISAGRTKDISQLAYLLSKCNLFIGNDSTPMHLSASVGIPCIAIFGPANPKKWGPYGKKHISIRKNITCSPCWSRGEMKKCKLPLKCETEIKTQDVLSIVEKQLGGIRR